MLSFLRHTSPARLALFLIFGLTFYRLWFMTRVELVPDEAYYWLWAKHPAWSYRDKGPAVAWVIWLGTKLFGDTVFGVRFFAVILSSATGWLLWLLARRMYDDVVALWSLVLAAVIPMLAVGSVLMTIDSISVLSWAWAALILWQAIHRDKLSDWFWMGVAIGIGFLAKFTNGVQLGCIALFLFWSKEHRPLLFSQKILVLGAAFALGFLPVLVWNIQTGWVHVIALHSRSGVTNTFGIHPLEILRFIGGQFGVVSPLIMLGMVLAAFGLWKNNSADVRVKLLLTQCVPLYAFFMFFSLNSEGKPNWIVPALVTGVIFTVVYWREKISRQPKWKPWAAAALIIALVMSVLLHDTDPFLAVAQGAANAAGVKQQIPDPLRRGRGWHDFAAHVQAAREKYHANILIAEHYSQASMMAFYLPDQPTTYLLPQPYGSSQFTLWPGFDWNTNSRALFVSEAIPQEYLQPVLNKHLGPVEKVDDFWSQYHGRPETHFQIYLCTPN
jgi:4-amino-4-deoxy-L-arabinose transferase-like glycosyltransferase